MKENNIRLCCIGQKEKLPDDVRKVLDRTIADTSENSGMVLNLALSYGSRFEIVRSVQKIAQLCKDDHLDPANISEATIEEHLYTSNLPDPDLIIRTGGESRLSNFLLWQASYSEIYITDTHWPDFRRDNLLTALEDFQSRQRRFGKTGQQIDVENEK